MFIKTPVCGWLRNEVVLKEDPFWFHHVLLIGLVDVAVEQARPQLKGV